MKETMRLIDYREIRKLFDEQYKQTKRLIQEGETHLDSLAEGFSEADHIIRDLPDVDAVEVVRCENCKHGQRGRYGYMCEYDRDKKYMNGKHYCSFGEKMWNDGGKING